MVAVVYVLLVGLFFLPGACPVKDLPEICVGVVKETAKILFIVGAAYALAWVLAREQSWAPSSPSTSPPSARIPLWC